MPIARRGVRGHHVVRELLDQGHTLAAARRILALEDDLAAERALTARLDQRLGERDAMGG